MHAELFNSNIRVNPYITQMNTVKLATPIKLKYALRIL